MTETQWLASNHPDPMLEFVHGKAIDRKLRLFAVAACRRIWSLLVDERSRQVVELAEQMAEQRVSMSVLARAVNQNWDFLRTTTPHTETHRAANAANSTAGPGAWASAWKTVSEVREALEARDPALKMAEPRVQAVLMRDILGNPFRPPTLDQSWVRWNDSTVLMLAQSIYDSRDFSLMPILADALEDAGCDNAEIVAHCRQAGTHVRGCWVLDLLLGKS